MDQPQSISVIVPILSNIKAGQYILQRMPPEATQVVVVLAAHLNHQADQLQNRYHHLMVTDHPGHGMACYLGLQAVSDGEVVVFFSHDLVEDPSDLRSLLAPFATGGTDLVLGSRRLTASGRPSRPQAGDWPLNLLTLGVGRLWNIRLTDLSGFYAIRRQTLQWLAPRAGSATWLMKVVFRAMHARVPVMEAPVSGRKTGNLFWPWQNLGANLKRLYHGLLTSATLALGMEPQWPGACQDHLILMSRYPEPGQTKTRLIPALGAFAAAREHALMIDHSLTWARQSRRRQRLAVELNYSSGTKKQWRTRWGRDLILKPQAPGDLGKKMTRAFYSAFKQGSQKAVMAGVDAVEMTSGLVLKAFQALDDHDVVLGPAHDGGYYLIGLRRMQPALFQEVSWGTAQVLNQTLALAAQQRLSVKLLPLAHDIDRPEDLDLWADLKNRPCRPSVSVIIAVLNDADHLHRLLTGLATQPLHEIIVVDGGSTDHSLEVARSFPVRLLSGPRGRALQMNLGAFHAHGDVLLFLHADSMVPRDMCPVIREVLSRPGVSLGAFQLALDRHGRRFDQVTRWANWRARVLGWPYGDQGLFIDRALFQQLGGFVCMPIMEDYELVRVCRQRGIITLAAQQVTTSTRRWQRLGVIRTTIINQMMVAGYRLGVPAAWLAAFYRGQGRKSAFRRAFAKHPKA